MKDKKSEITEWLIKIWVLISRQNMKDYLQESKKLQRELRLQLKNLLLTPTEITLVNNISQLQDQTFCIERELHRKLQTI